MRFTLAVALAPADHYVPLAREAEASGFDGVSVPDGVFFPQTVSAGYPYTPDGSRFWDERTPFVDPWVVIPAMAAVTERVEFSTMVLKLPLRHPLLLAKTVWTTACLAPGRVALGVGLSWMPEEFRFLGIDFARRGRRVDEMIEVLRALNQPGWVEHHGEFFDFDRLTIEPVPAQRVPILVGGMTPPALDRAARLGDGWISAPATPEDLTEKVGRLRTLRADHGRGAEPFRVVAIPLVDYADPAAFRRLEDVGVDEVIVSPWFDFGAPLADKQAAVRRFADDVIGAVR